MGIERFYVRRYNRRQRLENAGRNPENKRRSIHGYNCEESRNGRKDNRREEVDCRRKEDDSRREEDDSRCEDDHRREEDDHRREEDDRRRKEDDRRREEDDNRREDDHRREEDDHRRKEDDCRREEDDHRRKEDDCRREDNCREDHRRKEIDCGCEEDKYCRQDNRREENDCHCKDSGREEACSREETRNTCRREYFHESDRDREKTGGNLSRCIRRPEENCHEGAQGRIRGYRNEPAERRRRGRIIFFLSFRYYGKSRGLPGWTRPVWKEIKSGRVRAARHITKKRIRRPAGSVREGGNPFFLYGTEIVTSSVIFRRKEVSPLCSISPPLIR